MIEFRIASTKFKVASEAKKQWVTDLVEKIKRFTGRTSHKVAYGCLNSNPTYPIFWDGVSTKEYVKVYERLNAPRLGTGIPDKSSIFSNLSDAPQFAQEEITLYELVT